MASFFQIGEEALIAKSYFQTSFRGIWRSKQEFQISKKILTFKYELLWFSFLLHAQTLP